MLKCFSLKNLLAVKSYQNKNIVLAFVFLRFLATCLITNTHYNDVYPIKSLAVGGLLGDVLFFVVSGFVLTRETNEKFLSWYGKRVLRIYPTVFVGVIFYLITGYTTIQHINNIGWFTAFVFPSFFVFAATIILLYIPFFVINKINDKKLFLSVFAVVVFAWIIAYFFLFDRKTYQMNNTNHWLIAFPYFIAMMFGSYIRKFNIKKGNILQTFLCIFSIVFLVLYFFLTTLVRANNDLLNYQIFVQISLLLAIFSLVAFVFGLEPWFNRLPKWLLATVNFIANFTLEIYIIQRPIIAWFSHILFPLNWIIITLTIFVSAIVLKIFINFVIEVSRFCFRKLIKKLG